MFKTKLEVDRHVENCLKNVTSERERNFRSYAFSKIYCSVGAYEEARRHVSSYLGSHPKSSDGYYVLGTILEKLGKKDSALEAYRTSLQMDPKQNHVLMKVCDLLNEDDDLDVSSAKYYCDLASAIDPSNPRVFDLKEKLMMTQNNDPDSIAKLLLKELEIRPTDINLRIRLLRNFVQRDKMNEAFKHVHDIEEKNLSIFSNSLAWYETVADVVLRFKREALVTQLNWSFWCLAISVLDRLLRLRLDERSDGVKECPEYVKQLFVFDQSLQEASRNIQNCPDRQLANEFLNHYKGQLLMHFATIIFKHAKKDLIDFKEAAGITLPLLFAAYHIKPVDLHASWIFHLPENQKRFIKRWNQEAAFRCSQAGHTLISAAHERKSFLIGKAEKHSSGTWQEDIYKKVFVVHEQRLGIDSSYFACNHIDVTVKLPSKSDVLEYDEESLYVLPDFLHHYVWVSLNNNLVDIKYLPFQGLQYSVKNLNNCGAETLNLLDVQAFLYACTICARGNLKNLKQMLYFNLDRPEVLPEAVTGQLCTVDQSKFFVSAYKVYKNETGYDSSEIRLILIRGIETIRCINRHGMDVSLLIQLADIFAEKAEKCKKQSEIEFNDARAEIYWKAALPMLEKLKDNQAIVFAKVRMFEYKAKDMTLGNILASIDRGKLFMGILAMKRKEHEKALSIFEELKDPYASFHQAQIYKSLADHKISQTKESLTSEMRSQNIILLSKARDCFYLTLDRLREPSIDKNHPLNLQLGNEIEKIERLLSRIDPDSNRNECENLSDENVSSNDSTEHYTSAHYTSHFSNVYNSSYMNNRNGSARVNQSTPLRLNLSRKEARPSPERLDAQLRQLMTSRDTTLTQVLEQSRMMVESQRSMVDELRNFKDVVYNLSGQVDNLKSMKTSFDELKDIKRSVDELKRSVDELQSFRNVSDTVYELKKEIQNMKKDGAKSNAQQDDVYALDDDYADYNVANNLSFGGNPYQNYANRMQQPPPMAPPPSALYPHGYYPPMFVPPYGYSNLGLAQSAAALAFGADQQLPADLRGLANQIAPNNPLYAPQPTIPTTLNLTAPTPAIVTAPNVPPQFKETPKAPVISTPSVTTYTAPAASKAPPVNVVITSSDPLPTMQSTVSQPVLSVTIPPQHIKGNAQKSQQQAHNYQIPLPVTTVTSTPSVLCKPTPAINTEGILSNVAPPVYSAVSDRKNLGLEIENTLENKFSPTAVNLTKPGKGNVFDRVIFESSGTLHVYNADCKEFLDKGVGTVQIKENNDKTAQLYMKKDNGQVIANHQIKYDLMVIPNKDDSFYWTAADSSSGKETMEKFCLKMTNKDDAQKFSTVYKSCLQNKDKPTPTNKLGGFVFTGSPIFKPKDPETPPQVKEVITEEKKQQSPFANFSFGARNTTGGDTSKSKLLTHLADTPPKPKTTPKPESRDNSMSEEFVPTAEFKPVIPLPDMVEVKTGEENAEVLFESRAKLLRYDSEKKEWKERGLGNMKLLKEETLIRLLMRREQVHKVCCNHQLLKSMNFQYMPNNFKALTWCAQDFAEEVLKTETFAIRFKTEEQATDFMKSVLKAQESLNEDNSLGNKETTKETTPVPTKGFGDKFKPAKDSWECKACYITNDAKTQKCVACGTANPPVGGAKPEQEAKKAESNPASGGWGDAFKPKAGSWECDCCMVRNDASVLYCASCESPKDSTVPKKESSGGLKGINLDTPFKFTFGIGAGTTLTQSQPEPAKLEPSSTFKFGESTAKPSAFGSSTFSFQPPKLDPPQPVATTPSKGVAGGFVFGSPDDHQFEFKPRSPRKSSGGPGEESDGSYVEEECDNIYFKPVIPLPDKVEVKTGEEEEQAVYCHRAKLFRFVEGEWKERGVGDLKILRNKGSGKLRVLMRRDQVHKICLNHTLSSEIEYRSKDEKTWLFVAPDFSEGEVSYDQFCLRFKTSEIAKEFKDAVDKALSQTTDVEAAKEEDDVVLVSETAVSEDELQEARKLQLPPKFFAYRILPFCNCAQCSKDDEYFKDTELDESRGLGSDSPVKKPSEETVSAGFPIFVTPKTSELKDLLSRPPLFKQTTPQTEATVTPTTSSTTTAAGCWFDNKSITPKNVFGSSITSTLESGTNSISFGGGTESKGIFGVSENKGGIFGSSANKSVFGGPAVLGNVDKGSVFGKPATVTKLDKTDVFGGVSENKPVFGSSSSLFAADNKNLFSAAGATENKNIFGGATSETNNSFGAASSIFENKLNTFSFVNNDAKTKGTFSTPEPKTKDAEQNENKNPPTNIFAAAPKPGTPFASLNVFGTPKTTPTGLFGSNNSPALDAAKPSVFGAANTGSLFGSNSAATFGSGASFQFGKAGGEEPLGGGGVTTAGLKEGDEVVLKCKSDVSFSSLAQQNEGVAAFGTPKSNAADSSQPFAHLGVGTPVFGSAKKTQTPDKSRTEDGDETGGADADEEYDPHYEPIVPMPDAIVVTTGEEDETAAFNERAKLYRYDADLKEWKERGVGQFKILHNPNNNTYRFLLRREQVHKVVLNQLITSSLDLQPMATSDRAWVWAGHNFVEDEMKLEKLAVRFKYEETAKKFQAAALECVKKIQQQQQQTAGNDALPSSVQEYSVEAVSSDSEQQDGNEYDDNDYDDYDDRTMMFFHNCTLQEYIPSSGQWQDICYGLIEIYYDIELYGAKICFTAEDGEILSNSVIGINTIMQIEGNQCTWRTVELAREEVCWRDLRAIFPAEDAAAKFHDNYLQGISYAQEFEIVDEIPSAEIEELD